MALVGNRSAINKSPGRFLAGTSVSGNRNNLTQYGMCRNAFQNYSAKSSVPSGNTSPVAWVMAKTAGGLSARNTAAVLIQTVGQGVMGYPISGDSSFSFTFDGASGQMIMSGSGTASFSVSGNNPLLRAVLNASGSCTISITVNNALLGARASGIGSASFTVTGGTSSILPTSTPNPRMTGTTGFTVSGVLVPYAIGQMTGTTEDLTGMTPTTVAQAVWGTMSNQYDEAGTMGSKLIAAGNAGDPWGADLSGYTEGTSGFALDIIQKLLRNKQITDPVTGQLVVYDDDGTTPLFSAQIFQDAAGSTPYAGKGVERRDRLS